MSITAINWAKQQKTGTPLRQLVLFVLADYADQWGFCWPSQPTVSSICQVNERSVRRAINELEASGHVAKVSIRIGKSPRVLYLLACPKIAEPLPDEHLAHKWLKNATRTESPVETVHPDSDAVHPDSDDSSPGLVSPPNLYKPPDEPIAPARAREEDARSGRDTDLALRQRAEVAKQSYGRYRYTDDQLQACIDAKLLSKEKAIAAGGNPDRLRRIEEQGAVT